MTRSWNSATRQYRQVNPTQGKRRNNLHFGTSYHSKKDTNYAGRFPEEFHAAEYGTFKLGEVKHAKHKITRVQNSKGNRGASTAQIRSL